MTKIPGHLRPEAGLLRLRKELGAFANLRPAVCFPALVENSPLRAEVVKGTDILLVRELLGGLYFGQPRVACGRGRLAAGVEYHALRGSRDRAHRPGCVRTGARPQAQSALGGQSQRAGVLAPVARRGDRAWAQQFPDVKLAHQYVDSAAMLLVQHPAEVDVLLTENMFGDILSDQAGGVVGGLGLARVSQHWRSSRTVRAGARVSTRHRRKRDRESAGCDSFGCDAAPAFVPAGARGSLYRIGGANGAGGGASHARSRPTRPCFIEHKRDGAKSGGSGARGIVGKQRQAREVGLTTELKFRTAGASPNPWRERDQKRLPLHSLSNGRAIQVQVQVQG